MSESRADEILRQTDGMKSMRAPYDSHWQSIAERCWPDMSEFNTTRSPGASRTQKVFDSTAILALSRFAAAVHSLVSPDNQIYQRLTVQDENLKKVKAVADWLEQNTKSVFAMRRAPRANWSGQVQECWQSLGAFGNQCLLIEEELGRGTRYKSCPLHTVYAAENKHGMVDCIHRVFRWTARQCVEEFGIDKLPAKIKEAYEKHDENSRFEIVHAVGPNHDRKRSQRDYRGMAYHSCYVAVEGKTQLREGGYRTFPYAFSRYLTVSNQVYGNGAAGLVLPDIKTLNEMEKTTLRAGHRAVSPPLLLFEDGALQGFNARPDALNFGGLDDQGRPLVRPLETGGNLPWAKEATEQKRRVINDAFLVTLFQILVEAPQMTATEALLRAQEKGQLLGPTVGRQNTEFLSPVLSRELDIMAAHGWLTPMPEELMEAGGVVEVDYTSPLSRLMRADDGVAILRTLEQIAPMAQVDPTVMDAFDPDIVTRELAEINGVPSKVLRSPEQLAQLREQKRAQQEAANMLAAAPVAADAANSLANAAATVSAMPTPALLEAA